MNLAPAIALSARQGGYLTRRQLFELGYTAAMVRRAMGRGDLVLAAPHVYRIVPMDGEEALLHGAILSLPTQSCRTTRRPAYGSSRTSPKDR